MSVTLQKATDRKLFINYACPKGEYPFIYDQETGELSRCLCQHGSLWRGNKDELCVHARHVSRFLSDELNKKVIA